MNFKKILSLVLLQSCVLGCGSLFKVSQSPKQLSSKIQIWGGEKVDPQDQLAGTAVAITKSNGFPFCTGVYLGAQTILTAAHCLTDLQTPLAYVSFDLETPTEWDPAYGNLGPNSPNARKVISFVTHEKFDSTRFSNSNLAIEPNAPLFDLGLLTFEGTAPLGAKPAVLVAANKSINPDTELLLAGYGRSDARGGDYGRLYKVLTKVGQLRSVSLEIVDGPNSEKGSCVGDSGGPVMAKHFDPFNNVHNPTFTLSGLVSYGPSDCGLGKGFNTDLRYFRKWVEDNSSCLEGADSLQPNTYALKIKCGSNARAMKDLVPVVKGSFFDQCNSRFQSPELAHTLQILLNKLGTQDCLEAAKLSTQIKILNLSRADIINIEPLSHFVALEELDISYNSIIEAKPLASLQNLKKINLYQSGLNSERTPDYLTPFTHLVERSHGHFYKRFLQDKNGLFDRPKVSQLLWLSAIALKIEKWEGFDITQLPILSSVGSDGQRVLSSYKK